MSYNTIVGFNVTYKDEEKINQSKNTTALRVQQQLLILSNVEG